MRALIYRRPRTIERLHLGRPFVFLVGLYAAFMIAFSALRLLYALSISEQLAVVSTADILRAFAIGLRFDQIIILYALAPLLLLLPWVGMKHRAVRAVLFLYLFVVSALFFLMLLVDVRFYEEFGSRLNFLAVEYLSEGATAWNLVFSDPAFWKLLTAWGVASLGFLMIITWQYRRSGALRHRCSWGGHVGWFVVFAALFALGIRGRIARAPLDWGVAYFAENQCLNQLALNGVYTLARNLDEKHGDPRLSHLSETERFPFVSFDEALDSVQAMLGGEGDEWLQPGRSLLRVCHQSARPDGLRPNVVVVVMESWSGRHTGALDAPRNLTPSFDSLARRGILFRDFYSNGMRSSYGLAALLCSFPSLPGRSIMKRYDAAYPLVSLPTILGRRGYYNVFVHGGDVAFDNMEGFLRSKGMDRVYGQADFPPELGFSKWGVPDHHLFREAVGIFDSLPRPFCGVIFTLSNHEPWDLPDSSAIRYLDKADSSRFFNAQLYADWAVGQFMRAARGTGWFDSTLFVFTSDHALLVNSPYAMDPIVFHIPLLIYGQGVIGSESRIIDKVGAQVDLIPTVMGILGGAYEHAGWGRDLLGLDEDDSGFVVLNITSRCGYLDKQYLYQEILGRSIHLYARERLYQEDAEAVEASVEDLRRIQRRMRMYLQAAEQSSTFSGQAGQTSGRPFSGAR